MRYNNTDKLGNNTADLDARVSFGPDGARVGPFAIEIATTLARGEPGRLTVRFPRDLADGPWKIQVDMAGGMVKHTATDMITFPGADHTGKQSTVISGSDGGWAPVYLSVTVLLVASAGWPFAVRRYRQKVRWRRGVRTATVRPDGLIRRWQRYYARRFGSGSHTAAHRRPSRHLRGQSKSLGLRRRFLAR